MGVVTIDILQSGPLSDHRRADAAVLQRYCFSLLDRGRSQDGHELRMKLWTHWRSWPSATSDGRAMMEWQG